MKTFIRLILFLAVLCAPLMAQQPIRIFIRSSEKTHGAADAHDYPTFRANWTKFLTSRGAVVRSAEHFPTAEELAQTDLLLDYASDGAIIPANERAVLDGFLRKGGGLVVIHDGMCGDDALWFAGMAGGSKQHGERNSSAHPMTLHFTDTAHPISKGFTDFEMDDEMFFLLRTVPEMHVLAPTPDPKGEMIPQLWTYEKTLPGGKPYRAFVSLQGHKITNFDHPQYQTLLLRGLAWAANRPVDALMAKK